MIIYEGIFFESDELQKILDAEEVHLSNTVKDMHCTFKFKPLKDQIFYELAGREFEIKLTGYGANDNNSGFSVELPEELKMYYINSDLDDNAIEPHVTVSLSDEASAKDTRFLNFKPLEKPIIVKGKFGFWISTRNYRGITYEARENKY